MFVLAPVLKGEFLVEAVRFVFDFTAASLKSDIISDKAPVLASSVGLVKGERVEVVVGYFHTVFVLCAEFIIFIFWSIWFALFVKFACFFRR